MSRLRVYGENAGRHTKRVKKAKLHFPPFCVRQTRSRTERGGFGGGGKVRGEVFYEERQADVWCGGVGVPCNFVPARRPIVVLASSSLAEAHSNDGCVFVGSLFLWVE